MSCRLPLFALPNLMLYPEAMIPLHLFEPRYRRLMTDLLEDECHELLVGTLLPGWEDDYFEAPPIAEVAGVGEVMQHQQDDQGNFNIVLRGKYRAEVLDEQPSDRPYRMVEVEPRPEVAVAATAAPVLHGHLLAALEALAGSVPPGAERQSVNYLADVLLVHLPIDMERKLATFSEVDGSERARKVLVEFQRQQDVGRGFVQGDRPEDPQWN
jgi:Lon protease-like protein